MFSIVLEAIEDVEKEVAISNLVTMLGIKSSTASQLIKNSPLKVYNDLAANDAKIMVEALNLTTLVVWRVVLSSQSELPKVNWNKEPMILNKTIAQIKEKIDPEKTGVSMIEMEAQFQVKPNLLETRSATFSDVSMTVLQGLGEGLNSAIETKDTISDTNSSISEDDIPNVHKELALKPGFYNLFLPALKSKNSKKVVEQLCTDILEWDSKMVKTALQKPIVCVAKDVDHIEGSQIIEKFEEQGILLNKKLITKM
jgi:hypothetical protein